MPRTSTPEASSASTCISRPFGSSRRGFSIRKYWETSARTWSIHSSASSAEVKRFSSRGSPERTSSHAGSTSSSAADSVRSAAGRSKSRSRTEWTTVPRVAACDGGSGSRSTTLRRNISGHWSKSFAREGESAARNFPPEDAREVLMDPTISAPTHVARRPAAPLWTRV
jgi:hypothetical protein